MKYKALRFNGGFRRPLRSLKEELKQMRTNEADREVHGFGRKLATCKCQELHGPRNNPDAARMDEIERAERKGSVQATSHQLSCFVNGFVGRADFDFFLLNTQRAA